MGPDHIHIGFFSFLIFCAYAIIYGFFTRMLAFKFAASPNPSTQAWGKALATLN